VNPAKPWRRLFTETLAESVRLELAGYVEEKTMESKRPTLADELAQLKATKKE
jgi:hypothetical protein